MEGERFFDSNGVRIRFVTIGEGRPVVLVHGFTGRLENWFTNGLAAAVADRHHVIAFDCRGHGGSDRPHDPSQYGAEMGLDVIRLLDHLGLERAHVVGYSMGAHILAHLLTVRPERLLSATLGGAAGRLGWTTEDQARVDREAAELELGRLTTQMRRIDPRLSDDEVRINSTAALLGQDPLALAALRRSNPAQVVSEVQMRPVAVPTLGVVGSEDPYHKDFVKLRGWMAQLKLVVIPGATHDSAARHPSFRRAVLEFIGGMGATNDQ